MGHANADTRIGVGIIGAGGRGAKNIGSLLCSEHRSHRLRIAAICDNHPERLGDAKALLEAESRSCGTGNTFAVYDNMDKLIADPDVNLVVITTSQDYHEPPFMAASAAGKMIFCEKPLAHTQQACDTMYREYHASKTRCMVGFTRRYEPLWVRAQKMVREGAIGTPHMLLLRSVIPYSHYFAGWWRQKARSGGLLNEKCSHHFDVFRWFADSPVVRVQATGGRRVFIPREGYPRFCSECDRDCPYRRTAEMLEFRSADDVPPFRLKYDRDVDLPLSRDMCVYSPEADVIDHAIVNMNFANGMTGCLFFSVFGQHSDDQETLEVVGDEGKLVLSRFAKTIDVINHYGEQTGTHTFDGQALTGGHFGADRHLIATLSKFAADGVEPPAGFDDAYIASTTAFHAELAVASGTSQDIDVTGIPGT